MAIVHGDDSTARDVEERRPSDEVSERLLWDLAYGTHDDGYLQFVADSLVAHQFSDQILRANRRRRA